MPGQGFNNILYARRFNALKQITGDLRKTKPLLKEKNDIFAKEAQFLFGERFESDIIRTAKSKQKSNEVFSAMTKKQQPFRRVPSWNTNKIKKGIKEICTVSVGRDSLQVPLSLFWSRSSSSNIYQNFKGTNFALEKASDSCDNISGRHVTRATDTRRVINEQRYNNFSSDSIGIVINLKKSILVPIQQIEFLGLEIDSVEMKLFFSQRKVEAIVQMSQNAMEGSLILRDLTKLLGKLTPTIQAILPAKLQIRFLQQMQMQALRINMN